MLPLRTVTYSFDLNRRVITAVSSGAGTQNGRLQLMLSSASSRYPPEIKTETFTKWGYRQAQTKEDHHPAAFCALGIMVPFFSSNYAILSSKCSKNILFQKKKLLNSRAPKNNPKFARQDPRGRMGLDAGAHESPPKIDLETKIWGAINDPQKLIETKNKC